jgi:hypothetical protein
VTYDPNVNARINALVIEATARSSLAVRSPADPNATTTAVSRNYSPG